MTPKQYCDWIGAMFDIIEEAPTPEQWATIHEKHKTIKNRRKPTFNPSHEEVAVLEFLNEKAGRNFQPVEANLSLIGARLAEGATMEQCKQVIARKCRDWAPGTKMNKYLRPATLFNRSKFAQYQGELVASFKVVDGGVK